MKKINVKFDGFNRKGQGLNREGKLILQLLRKHYDVQFSETPDYVFYNVNGTSYYKYDGIRIFCTIEAICPDFNLCDYGIGFEYLDYGDRYFRFPNYLFYPDAVIGMVEKHRNVDDSMARRKFCSFVYSNSAADDMRGQLFGKLSEYQKVESGGKYLNNLADGQPVADKLLFESGHKFSIACENASHPGYHTEKLAEAFAAGTIPIYWGDPLAGQVFNKKAYIDVNDYDSLEAVVRKVKEIDGDEEAYLEMLREPALVGFPRDCDGKTYLTEQTKRLEDYLIHLIDQPIDEAYRRNRGFWGRQYLQNFRSERRVVERYLKLRDIEIARLLRKCKYLFIK